METDEPSERVIFGSLRLLSASRSDIVYNSQVGSVRNQSVGE